MIKLLLFLAFVANAFPREKIPDAFKREVDYPVAELFAPENDYLLFLDKKVKAIAEGPYVQIQSIYTYKNRIYKLVAAQFEFPQTENDISHKVEIRYQDNTVRTIFDEVNSPNKEYSRENPYTKERFSYKEIQAGNVRAQDTVEIIFTVMRLLKIKLNQFYELRIHPHHQPRFTNQNSAYFREDHNIQIEIKSERPFKILANPTHQLQPEIWSYGDPASGIASYKAFYNITMYGVTCFTEEFKIYFASADFNAPQTIMATHPFNPHDHAFMLSLVPDMKYFPSCDWYTSCYPSFKTEVQPILQNLSDPDNFSRLKKAARQSELHYFGNEYLFVIDRSNAMKGSRLESLKKTLNHFLGALSTEASFYSILSFGSTLELSGNKSEEKTAKLPQDTEQIMRWVETLEADMGEKELLSALKYAFEEYEWTAELPKNVIILTDNKISNADDIIQLIQTNSKSQKICAIGVEGDGDIIRKIAKAGGCQPEFVPLRSKDFSDRALNVLDATFTSPEFNIVYEITCKNEQKQVVYKEEGGADGIPKDKAFIKWVTLNNIPNLRSCEAKVFYFSQHRCSSSFHEEIEILRTQTAQVTDIWHKVADYVKLSELQVKEFEREFMLNNMQEDNQILSDIDPSELIKFDDSRYEIYQAQFHNFHCFDQKKPLLTGVMLSSSELSSRAGESENETFFSFKIICIASVLTLLVVTGLFIMFPKNLRLKL